MRRAAALVLLLLLAVPEATAGSREECAKRIDVLGRLCLLYAEQHDGNLPKSLAALYYEAYVDDFDAFVCPGNPMKIEAREHIDLYSGYALVPPGAGSTSEIRVILRDAAPGNHDGAGFNEFLSDGTVRFREAEAAPSPPNETEVFAPLGRHVWLGVRSRVVEGGVLIEGIQTGGVAAQWGLLPGDVVSAFRGRGLEGEEALTKAVAKSKDGGHVPLLLLRDGEPITRTAVLGELPALMAGRAAARTQTALLLTGIHLDPDLNAQSALLSCRIDYEAAAEDTHLLVEWLREGRVVARSVAGLFGRGTLSATAYDLVGSGFTPGSYRVRATAGNRSVEAKFTLR